MALLKNIFDTRKILYDKPFMFFLLNSTNHIEFFSVVLKSDMVPGCILLNINPILIWEITTKAFPVWVFYVIAVVDRFLSWRPTFRARNFTCVPDQAERCVTKPKYTSDRDN